MTAIQLTVRDARANDLINLFGNYLESNGDLQERQKAVFLASLLSAHPCVLLQAVVLLLEARDRSCMKKARGADDARTTYKLIGEANGFANAAGLVATLCDLSSEDPRAGKL